MIPWVKKKPLLFIGRYRYTRILHKRTTSDTVSNCRPSTWPWNWCELVDPDATAWLSTKVWNGLQVSVLLPSACRFLPNTFSWANYAHSIPVIAGHQWDTSSKWQPLSLSCKVVFMRGSLGLSNGGDRDEEDVFYTKGWNRLPSVTLFSDFRYSNGHAMVTLRIWPGKLTCCHQDCGRRNTRSRAPAAPLSRCKNDKNVSFGHLWTCLNMFEHVRTVLQRFRAIQYDLIWLNDSIYLDVWRSLAGLAHHFQPGAASWWSGRLLPDMNRHNGTATAHFFEWPSTAHFFEWSLKSLRPNLLYHSLPEAISDTFCKNSRPNTPVIFWRFGRMAPILCLLAVDKFWLLSIQSICIRMYLYLSVPLLRSTFHSQALDVALDSQRRFSCRRVAPATLRSKDRNRSHRNSRRKSKSSSKVYKAIGICLTLHTHTHSRNTVIAIRMIAVFSLSLRAPRIHQHFWVATGAARRCNCVLQNWILLGNYELLCMWAETCWNRRMVRWGVRLWWNWKSAYSSNAIFQLCIQAAGFLLFFPPLGLLAAQGRLCQKMGWPGKLCCNDMQTFQMARICPDLQNLVEICITMRLCDSAKESFQSTMQHLHEVRETLGESAVT